MSGPAILAHGLRKEFRSTIAVDCVDLEVRAGEIFGLVGPDGAGKTTTIRMLCGIMPRTSGEATVAGIDVFANPEAAKHRIGYMSQRFSLYGDMTVSENIRFFSDIHHIPKAEQAVRKRELLQSSRMTQFTDRLAQNLSGGMKQKLALTCTLMHKPEVLFLDEPTTGVDPVSRRDFWKILYNLVSGGTTLFVSTPYMDEAERCNRVALMNNGRIIRCDTPDNLKQEMRGDLIEVVCSPQKTARLLLSQTSVVLSVQVFGDKLHILVENAQRDRPSVEATLRRADVQVDYVKQISPNLEDVFVSMLSGESAEAN